MAKFIPSSIYSAISPLNGLRIGIPEVNSCSVWFIELQDSYYNIPIGVFSSGA